MKEAKMKESFPQLPKKGRKKSFFTSRGMLVIFLTISLVLSIAVACHMKKLYQEMGFLQQDGGYHTVEGWKSLSRPEKK